MPQFETSLALDCTPGRVFDFIRVTANRVKLTPPSLGLHIVQGPEVLELGAQVEFKVHGYGIVQHIIHEVIEFDYPHHFTEKQLKGPLEYWVHHHTFAESPDGGMLLTDRIDFAPPAGLAGFMITEGRIFESLEDGFHHRHVALKKLLGTST